MEENNLKRIRKMINTPTEHGDVFIKNSKPHHIDFIGHMLHTFKEHTPHELKPFVSHILRSKTPRIAKSRMIKAHHETGGGFFDFLKGAGSTISNIAKKVGSSVASTASNVYDKAVPLAKKGLEFAKPYIKEYAPEAVGFGVSHIPLVGPSIAPVAKMGTKWLLGKLF